MFSHTKRFGDCFAGFFRALFFGFVSVLEGTGKGADYEEGKQKQWSN